MAAREDRSANRKKVRFPPSKAWDPEAKWTQDCGTFQECGEKHAPARCEVFKKMTPQERLCYRHLQGRDCWSQGRVPNCGVDSWEAPHHPLLQAAIMAGCVMVVQGIGEKGADSSVLGGHASGRTERRVHVGRLPPHDAGC